MKFSRLISLPIAGLAALAMLSGCGDTANLTAPEPGLDTTPPPAPSDLSVSRDASSRPVLTWTASAAPDVAAYHVYVYAPSPDRDNAYVLQNDTDTTDNSFLLPVVQIDTQAIYRVRAVDSSGNLSAFSASAQLIIPASGNEDVVPIDRP